MHTTGFILLIVPCQAVSTLFQQEEHQGLGVVSCPDYFLHAEGKNSLGTRLALVRLDTRGVFNWIVECSTHIRRGGITR